MEGQDLHWLGALHLPAVAGVQPRRLHPRRLLGHPAPGDGAQVLDVQTRRALWGRVGPLAAEQTRRQRHHILQGDEAQGQKHRGVDTEKERERESITARGRGM